MDSDYYSTVYAWFERCGIVSNMRTHLRSNLVNALKSKDMTLNKVNIAPKSAKQYIYDLLIAEYLWNHNYTYSLSVFASEAPLLVNFRKHVSQTDDASHGEGEKKNKLQSDYVWHTLETLGIKPDEPSGQSIITDYANNDIPLLLSILKYICNVQKYSDVRKHEKVQSTTQNCETQTDINRPDYTKERGKLIEGKKKLIRQKEIYNKQLREREEELKLRASNIEQQMVLLNEKLTQAQAIMQAVSAKELEIMEMKKEEERNVYRRKLELSVKENSLQREAERLERERDSYRMFENNLKKLQDELTKVQQDLPTKQKDDKIQTHEVYTQTELANSFSNKPDVDAEKRDLQSLVQEQQSRIEELTLRAVRLSRQLEEAQLLKSTIAEIPRPITQSSMKHTVCSESSSTDDIIQDAKQRLKRLEEESFKADQNYFNCMATSLPLL